MKETKRQGAARRELPAAVGDSARSALLSRGCADSASKSNSAAPWVWEGASKRVGGRGRFQKGHALWRGPGPAHGPAEKQTAPGVETEGCLLFGGLPAIRPPQNSSAGAITCPAGQVAMGRPCRWHPRALPSSASISGWVWGNVFRVNSCATAFFRPSRVRSSFQKIQQHFLIGLAGNKYPP